jgi:hypothetical protein
MVHTAEHCMQRVLTALSAIALNAGAADSPASDTALTRRSYDAAQNMAQTPKRLRPNLFRWL